MFYTHMAQSHAKKVPTVITPDFFQREVSKLVTKAEAAKLVTKDELAEAVAKLATKQELAEVKEELIERMEGLHQEVMTGQDHILTILTRIDTDRLSLTHGQRRLQTTVDDHETRLRSLERGRTTV